MNDDPKAVQHGGTHYKGMAIEPFELTMANRYDGAIHSIVKYVSRHASKGGEEDLWKAHHIVDIRRVQIDKWGTGPGPQLLSMEEYIRQNDIPIREAGVLRAVHEWHVFADFQNGRHTTKAGKIKSLIERLIEYRYPESKGAQ